jgi:glutamate-1-semialdehyde 2,1-aminomutase
MDYTEGLKTSRSKELYKRSCNIIPAGASSHIRTYPTWDPYPIFFERGEGSHFWDVDGNEYIDYPLGLGPLIHGHTPRNVINAVKEQLEKGTMPSLNTELEIKTAEKIGKIVPNAEMVVFTNTGLEATLHAIRYARGYTGKDKIVKFEGGYHGAHDGVLVSIGNFAGNPTAPYRVLESWGVLEDTARNTLILPWNDLEVLEKTIERRNHEIAAVISEPILMNIGTVLPEKGYLEGMRKITEENGVVMILDEVISGFRLALGGAQEYYGIKPDLAIYAKALGAGYPIAAITGKKMIMDLVRPGMIRQSGTYAANPLCLSAAYASITELEKGGIKHIMRMGNMLMEGIREILDKKNVEAIVQGLDGAGLQIYFTELDRIRNLRETKTCDVKKWSKFQKGLLKRGIYFHPAAFEHQFISTAHTEEDIKTTLSAISQAIELM